MTKRIYAIPGRLSDVLALIQVLALDADAHRSLSGIEKELQGNPSYLRGGLRLPRIIRNFSVCDLKASMCCLSLPVM